MKTVSHSFSMKLGTLALALTLAGCSTLHTTYERPQVDLPANWSQSANTEVVRTEQWWHQFNDADLNKVVETALERNNNLAVAAFTLRQAQLQADLTATNAHPTVSTSVSSQQQRTLRGTRTTTRSNSASLSASYELDLWGRISSLTDASRWEALATAEDLEATEQTLAGTAADLYWQLGYINQRIATSEQSLAYAQKTLQLIQVQYRSGAVSALEVSEAEKNVNTQQAALSALQQTRTEYRNALAILFDAPPGTDTLSSVIRQEPQTLPATSLPEVGAGVPADLLARRPDLRAAEMRLRSVLADADATRASYYPTFSLTGALGGASTALGSVLSNPYALLGAGVSLPFLQVDRMKINNAIAKTQYESAVVSFRQTLYSALSDVENALSARTTLAQQAEQLQQSLASAQRVERLYEVRYRNGSVALRIWLDAQESRRTAETALAENQLAQLQNLSLLYRVLGGSVQTSERAVTN